MKSFRYKAKDGPDKIVEGSLHAATRDEAVDKINEMGFIPVDIWDPGCASQPNKENSPKKIRNKGVKARDLLAFYLQLARLIKAGIPILRVLSLAAEENECPYFRTVLGHVQGEVREGSSLSAAMAAYPKIFCAFDLGMIHTGEEAGTLEESVTMLAKYHTEQREITSKVRTALAYPAFIALMGALTIYFMLTHVIPKFAGLFQDLGQELPLTTRILIAVSEWTRASWLWALMLIAVSAVFIVRISKDPRARLPWDRMLLKVPVLGKIFTKTEIARFSRSLELLLRSGIPILKALRMAVPVMGNAALKAEFQSCAVKLEQGGSLSDGVRKSNLCPGIFCHLVSIGEESGRLDEAFREIADWYEGDVAEASKIMTTFLEPVIILVLGLILTFIIVATLLPVFSINTMIV